MILYESKIEYMKFTPLIQLVLLAFLASACGDQHSPTSTALPSGTSSRTAQSISTKTVVHTTVVPTSTSTRVMPTQTASPSPTVTPTPTPTLTPAAAHPASEACFLTYYAPIAFMPDNLRILVRAGSGVQIFNLQTMQEDGFLEAPTNLNGPVVALSPDGETLAWGLEDNTIQLIRISDQELLHTLTGHTGPITKLRFSPEVDTLFFSFAGWLGDGMGSEREAGEGFSTRWGRSRGPGYLTGWALPGLFRYQCQQYRISELARWSAKDGHAGGRSNACFRADLFTRRRTLGFRG